MHPGCFKPPMFQQNTQFSLVDFLAFLFGVVMLLAFFFMTWYFVPGIDVDRSVAGVQIMSPITPINLTFLVPISAAMGMTLTAWGISDSRVRRFTLPLMGVAGLIGVAYYVAFFLFNGMDAYYRVFALDVNQEILALYDFTPGEVILSPYRRDILSGVGLGFWVCLVVAVFFVVQTFIPRPKAAPVAKKQTDDGRPPPINSADRVLSLLYDVPWWALVLILVGTFVTVSISNDLIYSDIYRQLRAGVALTLRVTFTAFGGAMVIGLVIGLIRSNPPDPPKGNPVRYLLSLLHLTIYNLATLLVEVMRGLPILIVLLISAFIIIPEVRNTLNETYDLNLDWRGSGVETAIVALAIAYGAFLSEIFRAGIQSVEKGQIEASRSLGMNYAQTMRFIVLPQAVRRVLPPLGNDFVAMLKDSSLVAILGIRDVTQIARVSSGSSFRYLETYLTVAVIYLMMTILGALCIRVLEAYLRQESR